MGVSSAMTKYLLDLKSIEQQLKTLYDEGYRSVAICLMHSYTYPGKSSCLQRILSLHFV
jgi:5-oxoprolinase (ATP-hydrolysing)